jgi:hypothetical protein
MYYRRIVTSSNGCGSDTTGVVTVTVRGELKGGKISAAKTTVCYNTSPGELTASSVSGGATPYTYLWQQSPTGTGGWVSAAGTNTAEKYTPPALTQTTYYRRTVTGSSSSNCGSAYSDTVKIAVHSKLTAGAIASNQVICHNIVPAPFTSVSPASGGDGAYTYFWQYSINNGGEWKYINDTDTEGHVPVEALKQTVQFRRMVKDGCETDSTEPVTVTVRSALLYNYPDLRIRACPDAGTDIRLSKYIDTLDVDGIQWSSPVNADGSIAASHIASSNVRTLTYTVSNPCLSEPLTRKIYLETLKPQRMRPLRDTVEICYETAEAVQISQIFGIDAGEGTWSYRSFTAGDVDAYVTVSQSPEYRGAVIMNGKAVYESSIGYYPYRSMNDAKKVEFTYTPAAGSCLHGQTYKIVIILTKI